MCRAVCTAQRLAAHISPLFVSTTMLTYTCVPPSTPTNKVLRHLGSCHHRQRPPYTHSARQVRSAAAHTTHTTHTTRTATATTTAPGPRAECFKGCEPRANEPFRSCPAGVVKIPHHHHGHARGAIPSVVEVTDAIGRAVQDALGGANDVAALLVPRKEGRSN